MTTEVAIVQSGGALTPIEPTRAEHYERRSRADRTWKQYQSAWKQFSRWCAERDLSAMPATAETVRQYVAWLADQGRTVATVNAYLAAIASAHSIAGHPFSRAALKNTLKGIRRLKAKPQRQVRAMVGADIRAILSDFALTQPSDARDALLLALGFAGAFRRSELVGLDWQELGSGTGYVERVEGGIEVTLVQSKGRDGEIEKIIIPRDDMPTACEALDRWVTQAALQPGQAVFRPIDKGQHIGSSRLTDHSVARIIKSRVRARALAMGKSEVEATALGEAFSGHSLRAGYCTNAAMAGTPEWKIRRRSRHKTPALVARYVRAAEEWTDSGLKDVGF